MFATATTANSHVVYYISFQAKHDDRDITCHKFVLASQGSLPQWIAHSVSRESGRIRKESINYAFLLEICNPYSTGARSRITLFITFQHNTDMKRRIVSSSQPKRLVYITSCKPLGVGRR